MTVDELVGKLTKCPDPNAKVVFYCLPEYERGWPEFKHEVAAVYIGKGEVRLDGRLRTWGT